MPHLEVGACDICDLGEIIFNSHLIVSNYVYNRPWSWRRSIQIGVGGLLRQHCTSCRRTWKPRFLGADDVNVT